MITVSYKKDGDWKEDGSEHLLLDYAKAHAVAEGYPEYKCWDGDRCVAHLFNSVKPQPKPETKPDPKPEPKEEPKVTLEELADEWDNE